MTFMHVQAEVARLCPLAAEIKEYQERLAEQNVAMDEAAAKIEATQLQADEAARREANVRDDSMRQVAQMAQLEQQLADADAQLKEAERRAEAALAEADKLREANEKVRLLMHLLSSAFSVHYLSVEPCHAYNSPQDVSVSWCISPTSQACVCGCCG
jgi:chromosome segregation ATPase